jgi:glucose-6-phosphate 1-dehydrogenase
MIDGRPRDQDIVIIGATGDLARRKLFPALYGLFLQSDALPSAGRIIGFARRSMSDDDFRSLAAMAVRHYAKRFDETSWTTFAQRLTYISADDVGYERLASECEQPERLVYLATPPSTYPAIIEALTQQHLVEGTKLLIEKPFGRDLYSAQQLEHTLDAVFHESQIFRIDHYLGKETVQNILVFRFGNSVFERVWNRDAIESVQITLAETIGIEGRAAFYEETGALRDVIQNHVLQVLSLLTMEPPASFTAEALREETSKLLYAMKPLDPADVIRGQYTRGMISGRETLGYREEEGVDPQSDTETFAALKAQIDNWRWAGVPFYLRSGKRLQRRATEIQISFRDVPIRFFASAGVGELPPNHLSICIEPDQTITFVFLAKTPGPEIRVRPARMEFGYGDGFTPEEAYQRLIWDAMDGDHTLFARTDGVMRSWEILQPVLDVPAALYPYEAGSWGPPEVDQIVSPGRWHLR